MGEVGIALGLAPVTDGISLYIGAVTVAYTVESLQNSKAELKKYRDERKAWEDELKRWTGRNPGVPVPKYYIGDYEIYGDLDVDNFTFLVDFSFEYQMGVNGFTYDSYP